MSQRGSPHEISEPDRVLNGRAVIGSQVDSSQVDFLQPLEDTQGTNGGLMIEDSLLDQAPQAPRPIPSPEVNLITRPTIQTTEEIVCGFQYQPPPSHGGRSNANQRQNYPETNRVPEISNPSRRAEPSPPENHEDELPVATVVTQATQEEEPIPTIEIPRETIGDTTHEVRVPIVDQPEPIGDGYPFPGASEKPRPSERKHTSYHSPFTKAQLPKPISDVRRKALANMSPRNRLSKSNILSSPSARPQNELAQVQGNPDKRAAYKNEQRLTAQRPNLESSKTTKDTHNNRDKYASRRHRQADPRKRKALQQPLPVEVIQAEIDHSLRPCSQASNISKPRAPAKKWRSPNREQNSVNLMNFAESWNANYIYNQQLLDRWEHKMAMLERHIKEQDVSIEKYQKAIESRDKVIEDLSAREAEFNAQNQKIQDEILTSTASRKKLEEKLRACRNRLNDAIGEQQRLFLQCREKCEKATASMKAEGQARKESIDEASAAIDLARADIKQRVATVIKYTNEQVGELKKTIESLETQLEEQAEELSFERQRTEDLRKELDESHELNEQSLRLATTQNQKLLEKIESERDAAKNVETHIQKQDQKIDKILEVLAETRERTIDPATLMEDIRGVHDDSVAKITEEVQNSVRSAQESALGGHENFSENLDDVRVLCEGIAERMTGLAEAAVWQQRALELDMNAEGYVQRIQNLQDDMQQAIIENMEQGAERWQLQTQLTNLQNAKSNEQAAKEKGDDLTRQIEELRRELAEKDQTITQSSERLEAAREELRTQARILRDKEEQIQNEHEKHREALESHAQQREHEIAHAVAEETNNIKGKYQDVEKQFREADEARVRLEQELAKSRQEIETLNEANIGEDLHEVQAEIVAMVASITKLTTGLEESEQERTVLRSSLEKWSHDRISVDQMKHILKRLARDQPSAIQMGGQLKELLEIQKKLSGALEYHRAGLASSEAAAVIDMSRLDSDMVSQPGTRSNIANSVQNGAPHLQVDTANLKRKVVVRSPANEIDPALPISIEEERSSRRQLVPARGIMKVGTGSNPTDFEAEESALDTGTQTSKTPQPPSQRRIAKRGRKTPLITHSMYNRPVAGSINSSYEEIEDEDIYDIPIKRQKTFEDDEQRNEGAHTIESIKLPRSMSTLPSSQEAEEREHIEGAPSRSNEISLRRRPVERQRTRLGAFGLRSFKGKTSYNQLPTGFGTGRPIDSQLTMASSQAIKLSDSQG
ncbi:uncharacterized protein F4822DRAFT_430365 [Hypoxylon trugodes]|uniref:uncharacterized protein n=1 Tax=Hypoxylon trugodes TaxID=326681 RepID=UPI00219B2C67|nr:uncharacterized protein F4822DRAFT_430365 [Hypoxylon trugodes]KAI1387618.1 hypothetical protein F4822DRAFT_430365 [Hypoxylon trugodes]